MGIAHGLGADAVGLAQLGTEVAIDRGEPSGGLPDGSGLGPRQWECEAPLQQHGCG